MRALILSVLILAIPAAVNGETIKVSFNSAWPPYSFGVKNKVQGIMPDLLHEIVVNQMGHEMISSGFPWKRAQLMVEEGEFDAFLTYASPTRLKFTTSSENVIFLLTTRAFVRPESKALSALKTVPGIASLKKLDNCVMRGDGWSEKFYKDNSINFMEAKDTENCLDLVGFGRLDVFVHDTLSVRYYIKRLDLGKKIVMLPHVYSAIPFSLMISDKSQLPKSFIKDFDSHVNRLKRQDEFDLLVEKIVNSYL